MNDKSSNYVAAWHDWSDDTVVVLERDDTGNLIKTRHNAPYYFYVEDEEGEYESIYGHKLVRAEFSNRHEYEAAKNLFPVKFESDFRPLQRVLMDKYYDRPTPKVNYAFFDIEADYTKEGGFPSPSNPYAVINAVTVYQSWTKKFITIAIPPTVDGVNWLDKHGNSVDKIYTRLDELIKKELLRNGIIPEIILCKTEAELITLLIELLQNADIISGWNSEFYDIPYTCERIILNGGNSLLARLEYPGVKPPSKESVDRYGSQEPVYRFTGKSHLDYLQLFEKFTFGGRTSYALGNILQEEVGIGKIEYDGTLEQLYKNDFELFVLYNFRDVDGLVQLDEKFKFIALANQIAHESTVLFGAVLGTVSYVETAITNHAHYKMNKIVHDKSVSDHEKVEGAVVLTPKIGLHEWIGSVDINSLYPNTIRSLNISPEKIIGQFTQKESAWKSLKNKTDEKLCCVFEDGSQEVLSAHEWKNIIKENRWAVSAYGTIFDQSGGRGIVADILGYWYAERKRLQAEKKKWSSKAKELPPGKDKEEAQRQVDHYDLLQITKKYSMNSLYGALLNKFFRYGDERMGASVTSSGRAITTYMIETIGYLLTGEKVPLNKHTTLNKDGKYENEYTIDNPAIIYSDTDSLIGETEVKTNYGTLRLDALFHACPIKTVKENGKQFGEGLPGLKALTLSENNAKYMNVRSVYRHKVSKARWRVTLEDGKTVEVTNDHSIMVEREGKLIEVKASEILQSDIFISIE
jgi:DNA polymerase elongation subunit (family B)